MKFAAFALTLFTQFIAQSVSANPINLMALASKSSGQIGDIKILIEECKLVSVNATTDRSFGHSATLYFNYLDLSQVDLSKTTMPDFARLPGIEVVMKRDAIHYFAEVYVLDSNTHGRFDYSRLHIPGLPFSPEEFLSTEYFRLVAPGQYRPNAFSDGSGRTAVLPITSAHPEDAAEIFAAFTEVVSGCQA